MLAQTDNDTRTAGEEVAGGGSFVCGSCAFPISLAAHDAVPVCPHCGGSDFRRSSLFQQPTLTAADWGEPAESPDWLDDAREDLSPSEEYVAYMDEGEVGVVKLSEGWTRIGRSALADVRLDDPTVSRRHALVIRTPDDELRVLDDRSLNGVFLNGERVEWAALQDGDELAVGRYRLYLLVT